MLLAAYTHALAPEIDPRRVVAFIPFTLPQSPRPSPSSHPPIRPPPPRFHFRSFTQIARSAVMPANRLVPQPATATKRVQYLTNPQILMHLQ